MARAKGTSRTKVEIRTSGPLFETGKAAEIIRHWVAPIQKEVAGEGHYLLGTVTLDKSGRGTGTFQDSIRISETARGDVTVGSDLVYGPWLEVGRSREPYRFKGYHLFRRTRLKMNKTAKRLAMEKMPELTAKLDGI